MSIHFVSAQKPYDAIPLKIGISKPYTQTTHPFGILFYNLPHNFRARPTQISTLSFQINSGNIWGQPVTTYIPQLETDRNRLANLDFFSRDFAFDQATSPAESYTIAYDGVVKDFRVSTTFPLTQKSEVSITVRSFLLTKGKFPFSILTGDRFIEFFHNTFAGGDDPFGRELLGMDDASIFYLDRNGNSMAINPGEFVFSGIETAFYHYPKLLQHKHFYANLGVHLGTNLSRHNSSLDLGVSVAGLKEFQSKGKLQFKSGLGVALLRKRMVSFQKNQVDLGTNNFIGSFEGHFEVSKKTKRNEYHSVGLNYRIQSPYNNKKEEDYYVPTSPDRIKRWHDASRQLYKFQSNWSLIYSFTKKTVFSIYLQQDMLVNNVPDFQTGVQFQVPFSFQP